MRDVEMATARIAERRQNEEYIVAPSRLSDIETKGVLPNIYRLYAISVIYGLDIRETLSWYGIDINDAAADAAMAPRPRSHRNDAMQSATAVNMPVRLDPSFDPRRTANLGRIVERWGMVPLSYLAQFAGDKYTYGYIGEEDFTMYPILPPGTFVQVDESRNKVVEGLWRSEFERPIYFIETRDGYTCCWCTVEKERIVLQPHPLSPVATRVLRHPQEAEVIGQVVGVAMRLGEWGASADSPEPRGRAALT